jgi:hypothetical protein
MGILRADAGGVTPYRLLNAKVICTIPFRGQERRLQRSVPVQLWRSKTLV